MRNTYGEIGARYADIRAMEMEVQAGIAATGTSKAPLVIGATSYMGNELNREMFEANKAKQAAIIGNQDDRAVYGFRAAAASDEIRAGLSARHADPSRKMFVDAGISAAQLLSQDKETVRGHTMFGAALGEGVFDAFVSATDKLLEAARLQVDAAKSQQTNTRNNAAAARGELNVNQPR
jgi:hypothetical protein